jgi:hypothetical protein
MEWVSKFIRSGKADSEIIDEAELPQPVEDNQIEIPETQEDKVEDNLEAEVDIVTQPEMPIPEPEIKNVSESEDVVAPESVVIETQELPQVEESKPKTKKARKKRPMTEARKAQLAKAREKAKDAVKRRKQKQKELEMIQNDQLLEQAVEKAFNRYITRKNDSKPRKTTPPPIPTPPPSPPKLERQVAQYPKEEKTSTSDLAALLGY